MTTRNQWIELWPIFWFQAMSGEENVLEKGWDKNTQEYEIICNLSKGVGDSTIYIRIFSKENKGNQYLTGDSDIQDF